MRTVSCTDKLLHELSLLASIVLARDAFVKTNGRTIVMIFCLSDRQKIMTIVRSVCPSETGVHYDHTEHFSADLSLWYTVHVLVSYAQYVYPC